MPTRHCRNAFPALSKSILQIIHTGECYSLTGMSTTLASSESASIKIQNLLKFESVPAMARKFPDGKNAENLRLAPS